MKTQMRTRNEFPNLLREMKLTGKAAFIGVAEGSFEFAFLDRWPGTAYLIDVWAILKEPGFTGHGEDTQDGQDARYARVLNRAEKYKGRALVMRTTSEDAASQFATTGTRLDFVYIDAQHDLVSARADVARWYPLVKSGGVISGHDFLSGHFNGQDYGVKQAVNEFASARGLTVNVIAEEWPSWWTVVKP